MDTLRRVYLGAGNIISSLGVGMAEQVAGIESYRTNLSRFDDTTPVCAVSAEAFAPIEGLTRLESMAVHTLEPLVEQSGVGLDNERVQLILSTTKGNVDRIETDPERSTLWSAAEHIGGWFHAAREPLVISNACISGVTAVVVGQRMIATGECDYVWVVGVDELTHFTVSGFNSFKSISPTVCRPYDRDRDGLTLGEGCGALLLTADRELSPSKIVVAGGGLTNDANHISGPSRTGDGLCYAMQEAMEEANITPTQVGFVNLHGTGTAYNDEMESKAMALAGLTVVPCNSLKPYLGHTLGASGVIEILLSAEQLQRGRVFGVKGYENGGVPVELNVSSAHRDLRMTACLKTASGFGGTNGAVVLMKEEVASEPKPMPKPIEIEQFAHVSLLPVAGKNFAERIREGYHALGEVNLKFGKMDDLSRLGYVAASELLKQADVELNGRRVAILLSNRNGSAESDRHHQSILNAHPAEGASPAVFVYTLPNIVAAEIAIKYKFQGETTFFVRRDRDDDREMHRYARYLLATGRAEVILYGWCELLGEKYEADICLIRKR